VQLQYTAPTVDGDPNAAPATVRHDPDDEYADVPRNAMCPCGSGKKFKRCHGDPRNRTN
jgi:preprotein translocase subunit SecA